MNTIQEDRYGMHLKVDYFLVTNATELAFNPAIATTRTSLHSFISLVAQADSTATRDITGFTEAKNEHRAQQIVQFKIVRAGLMGYYTGSPDIRSQRIIDFQDSVIDKFTDSELYMKTDQVLDLALPIKTLLVPYGVSDAQVDALDTLNGIWQSMEPIGRMEEAVNIAAGKEVDRYMEQTRLLIEKTLDNYMKVVQYNNPNLYSQYQTARMIDNSGGGSGTEGYTIQTYTIPTGGSMNIPVGPGPIQPQLEFYARAVQGGIIICTTDLPASPCTEGYELPQGTTFKKEIGTMGIDLNKPNLQFTNPGLSDAIIRAGVKND